MIRYRLYFFLYEQLEGITTSNLIHFFISVFFSVGPNENFWIQIDCFILLKNKHFLKTIWRRRKTERAYRYFQPRRKIINHHYQASAHKQVLQPVFLNMSVKKRPELSEKKIVPVCFNWLQNRIWLAETPSKKYMHGDLFWTWSAFRTMFLVGWQVIIRLERRSIRFLDTFPFCKNLTVPMVFISMVFLPSWCLPTPHE